MTARLCNVRRPSLNPDLPDGQIIAPRVQPCSQKYSCSHLAQITSTSPAVPVLSEGRIAIVTDVGLGCDGCGRVCDEARRSHTAKPCGPDAPTLAFKLVMMRAASHGRWWQS